MTTETDARDQFVFAFTRLVNSARLTAEKLQQIRPLQQELMRQAAFGYSRGYIGKPERDDAIHVARSLKF